MAHVLRVRAFKVGDPIAEFILMKPDDLSLHGRVSKSSKPASK